MWKGRLNSAPRAMVTVSNNHSFWIFHLTVVYFALRKAKWLRWADLLSVFCFLPRVGLQDGGEGLSLAAPVRALILLPALPVAAQPGTQCLCLHQNCYYAKNHNRGKTTMSVLKTLSKREIISLFHLIDIIFFLSCPSFTLVPSLFVIGFLDARIKGKPL